MQLGAGVAEPGQTIGIGAYGAVCAGLKIPSRRGTPVQIRPPALRRFYIFCSLVEREVGKVY